MLKNLAALLNVTFIQLIFYIMLRKIIISKLQFSIAKKLINCTKLLGTNGTGGLRHKQDK